MSSARVDARLCHEEPGTRKPGCGFGRFHFHLRQTRVKNESRFPTVGTVHTRRSPTVACRLCHDLAGTEPTSGIEAASSTSSIAPVSPYNRFLHIVVGRRRLFCTVWASPALRAMPATRHEKGTLLDMW